MRRIAVMLSVGVSLLAGLVALPGRSGAGVEPKTKEALLKIAAAIEKGSDADATKDAKALAKSIEELNDVMHGFKLRTKKGLGVGSKPGVALPDGIELKLNAIGRDGITPAQLKKEAD